MATLEDLVHTAKAADERLHEALKSSEMDFTELNKVLQSQRDAYGAVLRYSPVRFYEKKLSSRLWEREQLLNNHYRKRLTLLTKAQGYHAVEIRKVAASYLRFMKESQRFYRQHTWLMNHPVNGESHLWQKVQKWGIPAHNPEPFPVPQGSDLIQRISYTFLICLGDLSRYREHPSLTNNPSPAFEEAVGFYELAKKVDPHQGHPWNQLAIIAMSQNDSLNSTYALHRARWAPVKDDLVADNLKRHYRKVIQAWQDPTDPAQRPKPFNMIDSFVYLCARSQEAAEFPERRAFTDNVMNQLIARIREKPVDSMLFKLAMISISEAAIAEARLPIIQDAPKDTKEAGSTLTAWIWTFSLSMRLLSALLECLGLELSSSDVEISAVTRRVLPSIRTCLLWLAASHRYAAAFYNSDAVDPIDRSRGPTFWKRLAGCLTGLVRKFPDLEMQPLDYMLEEEADTLNFGPLSSLPNLAGWYDDEQRLKKTASSENMRVHSNKEMESVIKAVLTCGHHIAATHETPLKLTAEEWFTSSDDTPAATILASVSAEVPPLPVLAQLQPAVEQVSSTALRPTSSESLSSIGVSKPTGALKTANMAHAIEGPNLVGNHHEKTVFSDFEATHPTQSSLPCAEGGRGPVSTAVKRVRTSSPSREGAFDIDMARMVDKLVGQDGGDTLTSNEENRLTPPTCQNPMVVGTRLRISESIFRAKSDLKQRSSVCTAETSPQDVMIDRLSYAAYRLAMAPPVPYTLQGTPWAPDYRCLVPYASFGTLQDYGKADLTAVEAEAPAIMGPALSMRSQFETTSHRERLPHHTWPLELPDKSAEAMLLKVAEAEHAPTESLEPELEFEPKPESGSEPIESDPEPITPKLIQPEPMQLMKLTKKKVTPPKIETRRININEPPPLTPPGFTPLDASPELKAARQVDAPLVPPTFLGAVNSASGYSEPRGRRRRNTLASSSYSRSRSRSYAPQPHNGSFGRAQAARMGRDSSTPAPQSFSFPGMQHQHASAANVAEVSQSLSSHTPVQYYP